MKCDYCKKNWVYVSYVIPTLCVYDEAGNKIEIIQL